MNADLVELLVCPVCRGRFGLEAVEKSDGRVLYGSLFCHRCETAVPICSGFPLFAETRRERPRLRPDLEEIEGAVMGDAVAYAASVEHRYQCPAPDDEAAFQPFTEAAQSLFPLVPRLRRSLRPGDVIVDLDCRSGWSSELLAGLFPQQRVVSVCESADPTLGYAGFRYWLGELERAANLEVLFCSPSGHLPMSDASAAFVYGFDTLHRHPDGILLAEGLRILRRDGAAIFAQTRPMEEGAETFSRLLAGRETRVSMQPGLVVVLPPEARGEPLRRDRSEDPPAVARAVINPAWRIDLHLAVAHLESIESEPCDGATIRLTQEECEFLFWADRCVTIEEIGGRTARPTASVAQTAASLAGRHVVEVRPVSRAMASLQRFYRAQTVIVALARQTVQALWRESRRAFASRPLLIVDADGSVFRYEDAAEISLRVAAALRRAGVRAGDVVAVCNSLRAEVAFTFWGCAEIGAVFAGLDRNTSVEQTREILEWLKPKLLLCHAGLVAAARGLVPCVLYATESDEPPPGTPAFADWIDAADALEPESAQPGDPGDVAVLLQTSGTSGRRKCVEVSHGSLYRTAMLLVRTFDWQPGDVVVSTGDAHASQGLRSPLVAAVAAGASFVVLSAAQRRNPTALADAIRRHRVTALVTVPATLQLLVGHEARLPPSALASLRMVISISAPLPHRLASAFRARFGLPVLDQYGLTESPFATALTAASGDRSGSSIGRPLDGIVQIVGEDGAVLPPEEIGEVRIYSENTMLGYRGPGSDSGVRVENGWCYTADVAVRDAQGFLKLLSRRRDIIKGPSGDIVFPAEVEELVKRQEGVRDAGACGYPTPEGEERIALFVVPVEPPRDPAVFIAQLRKQILGALGSYRVPSRVDLVDSLPRLHDGSLLRHELAARCR